MTPQQSWTFSNLTSRETAISLNDLVDSELVRDASAVSRMVIISWDTYGGRQLSLPDTDIAVQALSDMYFNSPEPTQHLTGIRRSDCSIDSTLAVEELDASQRKSRLTKDQADEGVGIMRALMNTYPVPLDRSRMSLADGQRYDVANSELRPFRNENRLVVDLENVRAYWTMAQMVHNDRTEDLRVYGPTTDSIGKTIERDIPGFTAQQKLSFNVWRLIDSKAPSEAEQRMIANATAVEKAEGVSRP